MYGSSDIGIRLRKLREDSKISQKQVAERLGLSQSSIAQYESGKTELTAKAITLYAKMFGVSTDYILGLSDKPFYEHKSGNAIYFTTSKKPPDVPGGEPEPVAEKTFTVNSDDLPANRQELEQFVRNLLREVIPDQKTDEQK